MVKIDYNKIVMQNILQYSDMGVHVIDKDRKTIIYNEVMAKLEGLESNQVIGKDLLAIFPSLNQETSTLIKVLQGEISILNRTQIYLNFKGQKITTINSTIPLIYNEKIVGALEIAKDISNIRNLSDQLIDLQSKLKLYNANQSIDKKNQKYRIKRYSFTDIIGEDEGISLLKKLAKKASNSTSSVLIYGDTGTGKELFAQSIHYGGIRNNKPFIAQNCAAIPESLLEGILFGTEKGGFTGAIEREGIFEQANGGTLMLDEINSMSLSLQAKLLRVLQEGYIRRVGGKKDIPIDVRIIATTNEKPTESIKNNTLRKDLFYRLNVIFISIPPLRERKKDIPILTKHFINKYRVILDKNIKYVSKDILDLFLQYNWPGNVRELSNVIEGAINIADEDKNILQKEDFMSSLYLIEDKSLKNKSIFQDEGKSLPEVISEIEKEMILDILTQNQHNISKTSRILGIKRQTLQHKLKKYEIIVQ